MVREIPSAIQALYPDLVARLKGAPPTAPPVGSTFRRRLIKAAHFWYVQEPTRPDGHRPPERYFGRDTARVVRQIEFARIEKEQAEDRRLNVRALLLAGISRPDRFKGDVIAALSEWGMFGFGGVLLGADAYRTYGPALGFRLDGLSNGSENPSGTDGVVSVAIKDAAEFSFPDMLQNVDASFRETQTPSKSFATATFVNKRGFRIDAYDTAILGRKPARSSDNVGNDRQLFMRFLVHKPIDAALMHRSGVFVRVPDPGRYAVHLLLSAAIASGKEGARLEYDVVQAASLVEALARSKQGDDFKILWNRVWSKRAMWKGKLEAGSKLLPRSVADFLSV